MHPDLTKPLKKTNQNATSPIMLDTVVPVSTDINSLHMRMELKAPRRAGS